MIVITGASGLVGSFVLKEILTKEEKLRVIINKTPLPNAFFDADELDKIEVVQQDLCDISQYERIFDNASIIIHCAGKVSFNTSDRKELLRINFELTKDLVDYCLKQVNPPTFIFMSSVATLCNTQLKNRDETTIVEDKYGWNNVYSQSKYLAEKEVLRGNIEGLKTIIVNPSVVFGPTISNNTSLKFFDFIKNKRKYYPTGMINYVDARDVGIAVRLLIEKEIYGEKLVLNGGTISYQALFKSIGKELNIVYPMYKANKNLLMGLAKINSLFQFFGIRTKFFPSMVSSAYEHIEYKNDKSLEQLQLKYHSISNTIKFTLEMMKKLNKTDIY